MACPQACAAYFGKDEGTAPFARLKDPLHADYKRRYELRGGTGTVNRDINQIVGEAGSKSLRCSHLDAPARSIDFRICAGMWKHWSGLLNIRSRNTTQIVNVCYFNLVHWCGEGGGWNQLISFDSSINWRVQDVCSVRSESILKTRSIHLICISVLNKVRR